MELAYELSREQIRHLTGDRRPARLAVVMTKSDVLDNAHAVRPGETAPKLANGHDGLNLGNITREAGKSFRDVAYFRTAAITDESGAADTSVIRLAAWLLRAEGVRLKRCISDDGLQLRRLSPSHADTDALRNDRGLRPAGDVSLFLVNPRPAPPRCP
jgi:hypothetical protein